MKQFNTLENEIMMFVEPNNGSAAKHKFSCLLKHSEATEEHFLQEESKPSTKPGSQVIRNILNYARSLEVLKPKTGEAHFLIGN
jgi:hypothetical protein